MNRLFPTMLCVFTLLACKNPQPSMPVQSAQPACEITNEQGCFWMENTSGHYCWVTQDELDFNACQMLDSCTEGGGSMSGGGCYKWSEASDSHAFTWPVADPTAKEGCPETMGLTCYAVTEVDERLCWTPIDNFEGTMMDCLDMDSTKFAEGSSEPAIELGDEMCP